MVVNDLNILGTFRSPHKANAPQIVDTDAVLTPPFSLQSFELIAWWYAQVLQNRGPIKLLQLPQRRAFDIDPATYAPALKEGLGVLALEALYCHASIITQHVHNGKRYYGSAYAT